MLWRLESLQEPAERPFSGFAILVLAVVRGGEAFPEERIAQLADWVVAEESRSRPYLPDAGPRWLLGLADTWSHRDWERIGARLTDEATKYVSRDLREWLAHLGSFP